MAFTDYGLGLGLAYRHNWEAADRFKIATIEMGQREKERLFRKEEAERNRQERENERIMQGNREASGYTETTVKIPEGPLTDQYSADLAPRMKYIAEFTADPDWRMNIKNYDYLNETKKHIRDHPVAKKVLEATEMFEMAKKEYETGLIDKVEFAEEQKKFSDFEKKSIDYTYFPRQNVVENLFHDYFGSVSVDDKYFGSKDELANANEFYNNNMPLLNRRFHTLPASDQKWYKNNPREWTLAKSRLYTGASVAKSNASRSSGGGGKPTQAEILWDNALEVYKNDFVNYTYPPGVDPEKYIVGNDEVSNFIPLDADGAYGRDRIALFDDSGEEVVMETIDSPIHGMLPIKRLSSRWRKYKGDIFVETVFQVPVNPSSDVTDVTEEKTRWHQQSTYMEKTGEKIVATQMFNKLKEKGAIMDVDLKSANPSYTFKGWSKFNPGQKEIKDYYMNSYGEQIFNTDAIEGAYDETPDAE